MYLRYFILLMSLWRFACIGAQTALIGVSEQLAQARSKCVSEVEYDLVLTIPDDKTAPVSGEETISFSWDGSSDLLLDFQALSEQLGSDAVVNGKRRQVSVADEHIILSNKWLRRGKRNKVTLTFHSGDKALNRHDDYLYSLFVPDHARSVFPCFDQPDLKAKFRLRLNVPDGWKTMTSVDDAPIPTYLFSFVAGRFEERQTECDGCVIRALYRETDSLKVSQLPDIFDEVALSIRWMEEYTGVAYPFSRYGFVVLPGYQFGGMEHPGAIQFADWEIFIPENPTPDERLVRLNLIAHETAHMWFGDLVTMRWFNDVWTKEVFANFMASKVAEERFPDINHDINFLKDHYIPALATDRTLGTHPIQQPLENLNQAGLLYGNIIYHKAPLMMRKLEEQMGKEEMRRGLSSYLRHFAYGNATWDDLIRLLDETAPEARVSAFDHVWVKEKGLPTVTYADDGHQILVSQHDPFSRGLEWIQPFEMKVVEDNGVRVVIPNYGGFGYGRFVLQPADAAWLMTKLASLDDSTAFSVVMTLYENYLMENITGEALFSSFFARLDKERNPLIASTLVRYMGTLRSRAPREQWPSMEKRLQTVAQTHLMPAVRQQVERLLGDCATCDEVVSHVYQLWSDADNNLLNERDYMAMAYHLAIVRPAWWKQIVEKQRGRIQNADRQEEFDFVSRACHPDTLVQQSLFESLAEMENRRVEPYASKLLTLLNDPLREPFNNRYILPGLKLLEEIRRTGDIFFPGNWCNALLSGHHSAEAASLVRQFLTAHPDYPEALRNKILQAADGLLGLHP